MRATLKKHLSTAALCALLCSGMVMAGHEAHAADRAAVPAAGKTADGKYPIYLIQGDLDDLNYSAGNLMWQPTDLVGRMVYVDPADIKAGRIQCGWVCKNGNNQIVGLNPSIKKMK